MSFRDSRLALGATLSLSLPLLAGAQGSFRERTLDVDLEAQIEAAASERERFAVDVPHAATIADSGSWTRANGVSTWSYRIVIPSAVSMSFHADRFSLPSGAALTMRGASGSATTYTNISGGSGELWGRTARGNSLDLELRVATRDEAAAELTLASVQAGFRVLGGGAPDHPHYRKLRGLPAYAASVPCPENFSCHSTAENSLNADATAAIVIGGVSLCTATLVNNTRNDGKPYLLTARHCQDGPSSSLTVYWDAAAPCGSNLASVYDEPNPSWFGGTVTVFEQQDVWMMDLMVAPRGARPYFAGWDVTGATFVGGYSPHHALGRKRQYTRWFGQASYQTMSGSVLGVGYDSNFWGVVNDIGAVGSGASGGGLFDTNHRLVGVASLAYLQNGPGSDGMCPVNPPAVPSESSAAALYVALSAVWESTADTTSFTNPVTLKSLLDPDNTGARVHGGFQLLQDMTLTTGGFSQVVETGWPTSLTWNAPGAATCVATGGIAGDGWAGSRPASGTVSIVQYEPGVTNYTLRCSNGARYAERSLQIAWDERAPFLDLRDYDAWPVILGNDILLEWRSNVRPCVATGGAAGDGWAGPKAQVTLGTQTVPYTQPGSITWGITCGTGARALSREITREIMDVAVELLPIVTTIRVNEPVLMRVRAFGLTCTKSGGAPGDDWPGPWADGGGTRSYTSSVEGTYRYALTCASGAVTATDEVDITFTHDAPAASLAVDKTSSTVQPLRHDPNPTWPPPNAVRFEWLANVEPCSLAYDGPGNEDSIVSVGWQQSWPAGELYDWRVVPGTYVYTLTCGTGADVATATRTIDWQSNPLSVEIYRSDAGIVANEPFTLSWTSNLAICMTSGGVSGDGWAGRTNISGSANITLATPGTYRYSVSCDYNGTTLQDDFDLVVPPPAITFAPHASQWRAGHETVSIAWTSTASPCQASGDWTAGAAPSASSRAVGSSIAGVRTYTLRCGVAPHIAEASTSLTWLPPRTVELTASAEEVAVGQPVTLSWTGANVSACRIHRSESVDWFGALPTSGSRTILRTSPGSDHFFISCDGIEDFVSIRWRRVDRGSEPFRGPTVTLTTDAATKLVDELLTVTWTSTGSNGCYASQGPAGSDWSGNIPVSGTRQYRMLRAGTFQFGIECTGAPPRASATVSVTVIAPPTPPPSSSSSSSGGASGGKSGGGGSLDLILLGLLGAIAARVAARPGRRRPRISAGFRSSGAHRARLRGS